MQALTRGRAVRRESNRAATRLQAARRGQHAVTLLLLWPAVRPCVAASRSAAHARAARCSSGIAGRQLVRLLPSSSTPHSQPIKELAAFLGMQSCRRWG